MSRFEGSLKSVNVLYAGDPRAPQIGWLTAAGARVVRAERSDAAAAVTAEDPTAVDAAILDADWPAVGWVGLARDLPRSCAVIVISDQADTGLLDTALSLRADFVSRSASEADFVYRA